jgi:hypothetical protein
MRRLLLLGAVAAFACRSTGDSPPAAGYRGIDRAELIAKGME